MKREAWENGFRKRIKARQTLYGYANSAMAVKMHMSVESWSYRLAKPERFKYGELRKLEKILNMNIFSEEVE